MPIEFEEDQFEYKDPRSASKAPKTPKMAELLVKKGIAKSNLHALKILVWSSIVLLVISIVIFTFFVFDVGTSNAPDPRYIIH